MRTQQIVVEKIIRPDNSSVNMPERKFRAGSISATVWLNSNKEAKQYRTISIERCYTDKDGKWQSTNSLRINDLPKAGVVLQKAYEYLILNENEVRGA